MSCEQGPNKAARAAGQNGVGQVSSKSGYIAGSTAQVSFFKVARRGIARSSGRRAQVSFFNSALAGPGDTTGPAARPRPAQRQIDLSGDFTPEELDKLTVELHLGAAATSRHLRELSSGSSRGIDHSDPRSMDWAQLDRQQYHFLVDQLRRARRGAGYIDTSSLQKGQLVELWRFARFEADRAHRNIDHLTSGLSHLKGPTAGYLAEGHKLQARFYTFLTGHLERIIPAEARATEEAW